MRVIHHIPKAFSIHRMLCLLPCALIMLSSFIILLSSCAGDDTHYAPAIETRDSLPVLKSIGVSTLISDSGIIRYKIISEDWFIYDRKSPTYWSFEKGLFIEKFDENYHVDAYINCDTAYYYDQIHLWELRSRVLVKNMKGETFKTSLLYWNQNEHRIYSPAYMRIQGIEQELDGYDFTSNEQMTEYLIHSSSGAFPVDENESPHPNTAVMAEMNDSASVSGDDEPIGVPKHRLGALDNQDNPSSGPNRPSAVRQNRPMKLTPH